MTQKEYDNQTNKLIAEAIIRHRALLRIKELKLKKNNYENN